MSLSPARTYTGEHGSVMARVQLTALMWSVKDRRSSSLTECSAFVPAVPFTEIRPLFDSNLQGSAPSNKRGSSLFMLTVADLSPS